MKLSVIVFTALIAISCAENSGNTASTRKVKCEAVQNITQLNATSIYPGKIEAAKEVNRAFRVAGVVEQIKVKEGDFVAEGRVIATMDNRDYKLQLAATQAEYNAIKGEVERIVQLYKEESVTANDYDKAVNGLKQIEAKLESHKNALADTELTAPFAGYIQKIFFDRGATVAAGTPILSIVSSSAPEVVVNIPANEYLKRDEMVSASATSELYGVEKFELKHIGTTHKANLNQLYTARFQMVATKGTSLPSPGMSVMVTLNYSDSEKQLVSIPFSAVVERDGATAVWILEGGKATLRKVEVENVNSDGRAIIGGGIYAGEVVITAGVNSLKEGQAVEPLTKASNSNIGNIL